METKHVKGKNKGNILLYALSTCGWCGKTKKLLEDLDLDFFYVDVDLLEGKEKEEAIKELERWNKSRSFPTLVIDNKKCIVGFKEDSIRKALGL